MKLALVVAMVAGMCRFVNYSDGTVVLYCKQTNNTCYANWEVQAVGPCLPIPKELQ